MGIGKDITRCDGLECPLKNKCKRFKSYKIGEYKPIYQSTFWYPPYDKNLKKCQFFIGKISDF